MIKGLYMRIYRNATNEQNGCRTNSGRINCQTGNSTKRTQRDLQLCAVRTRHVSSFLGCTSLVEAVDAHSVSAQISAVPVCSTTTFDGALERLVARKLASTCRHEIAALDDLICDIS